MNNRSKWAGLSALILAFPLASPASADDAQLLRELRMQMEKMQSQIEALEKRLEQQGEQQEETAETVAKQQKAAQEKAKAVQVYGQMRVSVDHQFGDFQDDGTAINSNASRLGVQGTVPTTLPVSGTNMIYRAEVRYETTDAVNGGPGTTTGTKQLEFREGYAGLQNKRWGKLRLGRLSTEYKKTLTTIDPWNDNVPQSRSGGRQGSSELHSSYFNNAADYVTPAFFGGVRGSVWGATEFDNSSKPLHNTSTLQNYRGGQAGGVGVKYKTKKGPLFLAADYIHIDADERRNANLKNGSGWQVAGRYRFDAVNLSTSALYEDVDGLGLGRNAYANLIYHLGDARFIGAYGINRDGDVYKNEDYHNWSLGVKYNIFKKSELLAAFNRRTNQDTNEDFDTITVGINAKFGY